MKSFFAVLSLNSQSDLFRIQKGEKCDFVLPFNWLRNSDKMLTNVHITAIAAAHICSETTLLKHTDVCFKEKKSCKPEQKRILFGHVFSIFFQGCSHGNDSFKTEMWRPLLNQDTHTKMKTERPKTLLNTANSRRLSPYFGSLTQFSIWEVEGCVTKIRLFCGVISKYFGVFVTFLSDFEVT